MIFQDENSCFLQYFFHSNFVGLQPNLFIEGDCWGVATPYVEGYVVAAHVMGEIFNGWVERSADVLPPTILVYAQIVYV